jgi:hypothetical protein
MHFGKHLMRRERVAGGAVDTHLARVQYRGRLPPQQVARAVASLNVGGMNQPRPPAEPGNRCSLG